MAFIFHRVAALPLMLLLAGCCPQQCLPAAGYPAAAPVNAAFSGPKAGDVLHVMVAGENDLTGDYTVGPDGRITMPLVGAIAVAGQKASALAGVISDAYRNGYLVDPKVSVEVNPQ